MGAVRKAKDMRPRTRQDYRERILRVLVHIQQNLDAALDLEDLARIACFSPFHFHRIFRGMVGESVKEHVRRLRLERAAMRLKHTDRPVTGIAFEAGYETHESFSRAFKMLHGVSPSGFRKAPSSVQFLAAGDPDHLGFHERNETAMDVRIETVAPMRVAFIRHTGPYDQVGPTWQRLCTHLGPKGLLGPSSLFLGVCHDDPEVTPQEKVRYDACVTVDETFSASDEVGVQVLAGGDYAIATHEGPYENLKVTYGEIYGVWLPGSGREPRPLPCFELYRNNPQEVAPADLRTDIYVPLEPAR
jgi:AraC family transcriptional regulator